MSRSRSPKEPATCSPRPAVSLARCVRYDDASLDRAVTAALEGLDDWEARFAGDPVVLLKPNLLGPRGAETAITTHPRFIASVARVIRSVHTGRLLVGDGPAIGTTRMVARTLGLPALLAPLDAELVDFAETVPVSGGDGFGAFDLARPLMEADVVVNLPKVKTHGQMGLTLAVKNLFGAFVGFEKPRLHLTCGTDYATFARMVLETARRVDADLHVADGVVGMEDNGPSSGVPRSLELVAASESGVGLDCALAEILGFAAEELPLQQEARRLGLPGTRLDELDLRGDPLDRFRVHDWRPARPAAMNEIFLPRYLAQPLRHQLTTRPVFDDRRCTRCGICMQHCAAEAMGLDRRRRRHPGPRRSSEAVFVDLDLCIRCFCCQEVCPEGALRVGEGSLLRLSRLLRLRR